MLASSTLSFAVGLRGIGDSLQSMRERDVTPPHCLSPLRSLHCFGNSSSSKASSSEPSTYRIAARRSKQTAMPLAARWESICGRGCWQTLPNCPNQFLGGADLGCVRCPGRLKLIDRFVKDHPLPMRGIFHFFDRLSRRYQNRRWSLQAMVLTGDDSRKRSRK